MDQINFIPPDSHRRFEAPRDPFQVMPGPWMANPNNSPMSWQSQTPFGSLYFSHSQSFSRTTSELNTVPQARLGQQGTMPYPNREARDVQTASFPQLSHPPIYFPSAPLHNMAGISGRATVSNTDADRAAALQEFGGIGSVPRGAALQQPAAVDWASPGATSDTHSLSPTHYSFSERLANPLGQQTGSQNVLPSHPLSPTSPRTIIQSSSPTSHRPPRSYGSCKSQLCLFTPSCPN